MDFSWPPRAYSIADRRSGKRSVLPCLDIPEVLRQRDPSDVVKLIGANKVEERNPVDISNAPARPIRRRPVEHPMHIGDEVALNQFSLIHQPCVIDSCLI